MVDFEKLMEEDKVIAQDVDRFLKCINEFQTWLDKHACERVYEYIEKEFDNVVIFKTPLAEDQKEAKPEISIWLPKWW